MTTEKKRELIERCAAICGRPFYDLRPGMITIDPKSPEPLDSRISQRELVSFINDIIGIRANEIRELKTEVK